MTYSLLNESWLPCVMLDGIMCELGIREALAHAPDIREIADCSPLVTLALHRLLLAILHRNFGPEDSSQWKILWNRGSWDREMLVGYFDRWESRFNLLDPMHPFYQVASLSFQYQIPISKLALELASGNNATLFDHSMDDSLVSISPALAARLVIAYQGFAVGGLVSHEKGQDPRFYKSAAAAPLAKGAFALVNGRNLFETLLLNLHRYSATNDEPFEVKNDVPIWERDVEIRPGDRRPDGYLDLLTWQSRRIRLSPEIDANGTLVIRNVVIMKGNQFPDGYSRHSDETMLAFRSNIDAKGNQDPWPPLTFGLERALWRDSLSFVETLRPDGVEERSVERPKILNWISDLVREGKLDRNALLQLDFFGLVTDRAKVLFWRHDRLPLPLEYLVCESLLEKLKNALKTCEELENALRTSARELAKFLIAPNCDRGYALDLNPNEINLVTDFIAIERRFWPQLEARFKKLLVELAHDRTIDGDGDFEYGAAALPLWVETVQHTAWQALKDTLRGIDASGRSLKAGTRALDEFFRRSRKATSPTRTPRRRPISEITERDRRFVKHLKEVKHGHNGRSAMAALRRALGKKPTEVPDARLHVLSFLRSEVTSCREEHEERNYFLVASLFASNLVSSRRSRNFGASMREVAKTGGLDNVESRFVTVLGCSLAELPYHLGRAIGLLKFKSMAIDWAQLLTDIRQWEDEDRHVQRAWARAFWSEIPQEDQLWAEKLNDFEDAW